MRQTFSTFLLLCQAASISLFAQSGRNLDVNTPVALTPICKLYVRNLDLSATITVRFAQHTFKRVAPRKISAVAETERIPQLGGFTISKIIDSTDFEDSATAGSAKKKKGKLGDLIKVADQDVPTGTGYYFGGSGTYIAEVTHTTKGDAVSINTDSLESQTDTLIMSRKEYWSLAVHHYNPRQDGPLPGNDNQTPPLAAPPGRIPLGTPTPAEHH